MNWAANTDWNDEQRKPLRGLPAGRNRETVDIVVCPMCRARETKRHSVVGVIGYWFCERCDCRWKEPAETGQGKAQIA